MYPKKNQFYNNNRLHIQWIVWFSIFETLQICTNIMHTKYWILVVYKKITRVWPSLPKQKQYEIEFKNWNSKTKHKQHWIRSLESWAQELKLPNKRQITPNKEVEIVRAKVNDKNQWTWKMSIFLMLSWKRREWHKGFRFFLNLKAFSYPNF
jgi:hypothetical protein